jgi:DNA-binding NarL/FixJ family response regulator
VKGSDQKAMSSIRILLVDEHPLFREGLHIILSAQPGLTVVGEAANGLEALQLAATLRPDVVLMAVDLPLLDGIVTTRRLRAVQPECRIILLTTFDDPEITLESLRAGAADILLKDTPTQKLVNEIKRLTSHSHYDRSHQEI